MNKYEKGPFLKDKKKENDKAFNEFREIILNNKNYSLGIAREIIEEFPLSKKLYLFERFKSEEGALPDNLALEYAKLVYSPENVSMKMAEELSFYEALSKIAQEIKALQIELDVRVTAKIITDTEKEILENEEEKDKVSD